MKIFVLQIFLLISSVTLFAQGSVSTYPIAYRNSISLNVAGATPFIGVSYERLLSRRFNFEVGIGVLSIGTAIRYYPTSITENKMVLHSAIGTNLFKTPFDDFGNGEVSSNTWLAVGLSYMGKERLNFSIEAGFGWNYDYTYDESSFPPYGSLKIGYRF